MLMGLTVNFKKLRSSAKLPEYKTQESAGMDCYASLPHDLLIAPGEAKKVPLGFAVALPKSVVGVINGRSGNAIDNIRCHTGIIDADFRGEVCAILYNDSDKTCIIQDGMRVAQLLVLHKPDITVREVNELPLTRRGEGGFGSTGGKVWTSIHSQQA